MQFDLYKDIATRTGGDIYVGVVGPVRSGKSTFIRRFMDTLVLQIRDKITEACRRRIAAVGGRKKYYDYPAEIRPKRSGKS